MQYEKANLKTEDQAWKDWCPQFNKNGCCTSECMAWRWFPLQANEPGYIRALKECEESRKMTKANAALDRYEPWADYVFAGKQFERDTMDLMDKIIGDQCRAAAKKLGGRG